MIIDYCPSCGCARKIGLVGICVECESLIRAECDDIRRQASDFDLDLEEGGAA